MIHKPKMEKMEEIDIINYGDENDGGKRRSWRLAKTGARIKHKACRDWKLNEKIYLEASESKWNKEKKRRGKEEEEEGTRSEESSLVLGEIKTSKNNKKKTSDDTTHMPTSFTMNTMHFTFKVAPSPGKQNDNPLMMTTSPV